MNLVHLKEFAPGQDYYTYLDTIDPNKKYIYLNDGYNESYPTCRGIGTDSITYNRK